MIEDETRQARIDKLIAEMESTIAEARDTSARMARLFDEIGIEDGTALRDVVQSDRCSPELRAMVEEDLARLDLELKESEAVLLAQSGRAGAGRTRRRTRRMTRV